MALATAQRTLDLAIEAEPSRTQGSFSNRSLYGYLTRGRYAEQVGRYLDVFDPDKVLILIFEDDIVGKQDELSEKIYRFVGVNPSFRAQGSVREGRPAPMQYRFIPRGKELKIGSGKVLTGPVLLSGHSPRFVPVQSPSAGLMRHVKEATENVPSPDARMSREDELELNQTHFTDDIHRLSDLIQRDLSHWLGDP